MQCGKFTKTMQIAAESLPIFGYNHNEMEKMLHLMSFLVVLHPANRKPSTTVQGQSQTINNTASESQTINNTISMACSTTI